MLLSITERLALLSILPQEGNFAEMRILGDLRMNLSFGEEETKDWDIVTNTDTQTIQWDMDKAEDKDVPIGEKATGIILDELRSLDKKKKITTNIMPIYEKFVPTIE